MMCDQWCVQGGAVGPEGVGPRRHEIPVSPRRGGKEVGERVGFEGKTEPSSRGEEKS